MKSPVKSVLDAPGFFLSILSQHTQVIAVRLHLIGGVWRPLALLAASAWLIVLFLLTAFFVAMTLFNFITATEGRNYAWTDLLDLKWLAAPAVFWVSGILFFRGAWRWPAFWRVTREGDWVFRNGFGRTLLMIPATELRAIYPGYIPWKRWNRSGPEYGEDWGELLAKTRDAARDSLPQSARELLLSRNVTMLIESCSDGRAVELPDVDLAEFLPEIGYTNLILDRLHQLNSRGMHRYRPHTYAAPSCPRSGQWKAAAHRFGDVATDCARAKQYHE